VDKVRVSKYYHPHQVDEPIGAKIRRLRDALELTNADLERLTGVKQNYIAQFVGSPKRTPPAEVLSDFSSLFVIPDNGWEKPFSWDKFIHAKRHVYFALFQQGVTQARAATDNLHPHQTMLSQGHWSYIKGEEASKHTWRTMWGDKLSHPDYEPLIDDDEFPLLVYEGGALQHTVVELNVFDRAEVLVDSHAGEEAVVVIAGEVDWVVAQCEPHLNIGERYPRDGSGERLRVRHEKTDQYLEAELYHLHPGDLAKFRSQTPHAAMINPEWRKKQERLRKGRYDITGLRNPATFLQRIVDVPPPKVRLAKSLQAALDRVSREYDAVRGRTGQGDDFPLRLHGEVVDRINDWLEKDHSDLLQQLSVEHAFRDSELPDSTFRYLMSPDGGDAQREYLKVLLNVAYPEYIAPLPSLRSYVAMISHRSYFTESDLKRRPRSDMPGLE
jgi:transcriptional regulator with XRE-family HTH domain